MGFGFGNLLLLESLERRSLGVVGGEMDMIYLGIIIIICVLFDGMFLLFISECL